MRSKYEIDGLWKVPGQVRRSHLLTLKCAGTYSAKFWTESRTRVEEQRDSKTTGNR